MDYFTTTSVQCTGMIDETEKFSDAVWRSRVAVR